MATVASTPVGAVHAGMEVPFTRLDNADPALLEELLGDVRQAAERGAFTLGEPVEAFEREFAAYCETEFAIGVSSGTEALVLALRALHIGPGDGVLVPSNSFIATAEAVSAVGAVPVMMDVDPDSHLITAEIVRRHITPGVRCVIPVHLYGGTVDLDPIIEVAREHDIHVVEDACQAHGARYLGRRTGSIGDLGCFSFYPAKNLGAWGDGGAVVTSDPALAARVALLRSHGEGPRYHHQLIGGTARLDALQATLLRRKLRRLDDWNAARRRIGAALCEELEGLIDPVRPAFPGADHVYHLFVVRSPEREELREQLAERGIATGIHYPVPIHLTQAYRWLGLGEGSLPVGEQLAQRVCSLPIFPSMTERERAAVVDAVRAFAPKSQEGHDGESPAQAQAVHRRSSGI